MRNTTLQKGLLILEAMALEARDFSLSEVASLTGVERSHACRLLQTLVSMGYVVQDPASRRYRVGLRTLELSAGTLSAMPVYRLGVTYLRELSDEQDAATYLGVRHLGKVLTIATVYPAGMFTENAPGFGTVMPLDYSAMGKVLLAHDGGEAPAGMAGELAEVAATGIATIRKGGAGSEGVVGVAAPVRDGSGEVVAALGISLMAGAWDGRDQERFKASVRRVAGGLSFALGHVAGRAAAVGEKG